MTGKKQRRGGMAGNLLLVGAVLYFVAWFVPAWRGQELFGSLTGGIGGAGGTFAGPGISGPEFLPGWQACSMAWDLLVGDSVGMLDSGSGQWTGGASWRHRVLGATCLSNVVMLAVLLVLLAGRRGQGLGITLLGCAALNASWLYLTDGEMFDVLGVGYWLWLASFVLVGSGLVGQPRN